MLGCSVLRCAKRQTGCRRDSLGGAKGKTEFGEDELVEAPAAGAEAPRSSPGFSFDFRSLEMFLEV